MWGLWEGLNGCFGFPADETRTFCVVDLYGLDWIGLDSMYVCHMCWCTGGICGIQGTLLVRCFDSR